MSSIEHAPGEEWIEAVCEHELEDGPCGRTWQATGTLNCRRVLARIQKHADRLGHRVDVQWANRRGRVEL